MAAPARLVAFAVVSGALIALAVALAPGEPGAPAPPARATRPTTPPAPEVFEIARERKRLLEVDAERFLRAFLRYEVGDLASSVAPTIDLLSTAEFGRYLLSSPPRQTAGARSRARLVEVETAFLDADGRRALIRGVARRPDGPEELSFVFVMHAGRWLAARAAE